MCIAFLVFTIDFKFSDKLVEKDLRDSEDYGEDWALSFKNERINKPKPKTLYSKRMEEKILGISAAEQKSKNEISSKSEVIEKDENILKDLKKEDKKKEEDTSIQALENLKKVLSSQIANLTKTEKKNPLDEKEPGEISDDEDDESKLQINQESPIVPILNNSEPIPTPNIRACVSSSDTSSETILEPPKTPDIINNSSLNNEINHQKEAEKISPINLEVISDNKEKSSEEEFQENQKLIEMKDHLVTEYSPFKNNYKLFKISPLKPGASVWRGRKNGMKPIENLGDTPKKSDIYNKEDTVRLEGNSSEQINHSESSLDLSKSIIESADKSTEEKELNITPSEDQNVKIVEETEATPNTTKKGRNVRNRNSGLKNEEKKELQESVKENLDKKGRNTRSKSKSVEKVPEKTEKPKPARNNKRKREESVEEVKKEPRKRKKSEGKSKEPPKKMKKEIKEPNTSSEGPSSLEETDPEKKHDVIEPEFSKPKDVTCTNKSKQFFTIQEKSSEIDDSSFSNSWMTALNSRMSVTSQVACLETPNKCIEEFKNLIINEQNVLKTGSLFSPLPCNKTNDFMTPRRMLKNDLMLTDSEEESPVKRQVTQVNEIAVNVRNEESEESSYESSGNDSDSGASDFVDLL